MKKQKWIQGQTMQGLLCSYLLRLILNLLVLHFLYVSVGVYHKIKLNLFCLFIFVLSSNIYHPSSLLFASCGFVYNYVILLISMTCALVLNWIHDYISISHTLRLMYGSKSCPKSLVENQCLCSRHPRVPGLEIGVIHKWWWPQTRPRFSTWPSLVWTNTTRLGKGSPPGAIHLNLGSVKSSFQQTLTVSESVTSYDAEPSL